MSTLIYLAGNLLRIFAIAKFINCFFDDLRVNKYILNIVYILLFAVNSSCYLIFNSIFLNIISNIVFMLAAALLYKGKISKKLLAVFFIYLMLMTTDVAADKLRAVLNLPIDARGTFGVVVSDMFMLIIAAIVSKKTYIKNEYHIVFLNKIILVLIPIASIMVEYCIYASGNTYLAVSSVLMLIINLLVFYIFDNMIELSYKLWDKENVEILNRAYEKQLEIIKANDDKTAVLRHDFKNQIAVLYELIEEDNEKALKHLADISEHIKSKGNYSNSGNKNIDSFLNYKFAEFELINCHIDCNIAIPNNIEFNPFEMTALLGNLLDNSLRALKAVENPYLYFSMSYSKNVVKILVKNPYNENLIQNNGVFLTTKKNKLSHGKGLNIITDIVKKYDGDININTENNVFSVNIYFLNKSKY